jgi:hypothetical protein
VMGEDLHAEEVLRRCQMPPDEIGWVMTAEDPAVVHMILELHRERLEEELAERRKTLGELEERLIRHRGEAAHVTSPVVVNRTQATPGSGSLSA